MTNSVAPRDVVNFTPSLNHPGGSLSRLPSPIGPLDPSQIFRAAAHVDADERGGGGNPSPVAAAAGLVRFAVSGGFRFDLERLLPQWGPRSGGVFSEGR